MGLGGRPGQLLGGRSSNKKQQRSVVAGLLSWPPFPRSTLTPAAALPTVSSFAASGLGGATNSFFMDALIRQVGMAWAFRVLGLVTIGDCCWPVSQSLTPLAVFCVLNGVSNGGFFSCTPTVATSIFGSQRASVVMGMVMTAWAGGYLLGSPIAGYLLQAFGGADGGL
ncbi:hypothetical protein NHJ13734_006961 [Beauveria thailandica]